MGLPEIISSCVNRQFPGNPKRFFRYHDRISRHFSKNRFMQKFLSTAQNPTTTRMDKKNRCAPVTDFLKMHDRISGMLPNVTRLISLQKACEEILPEYFTACDVLELEKEKLTIGAPGQAQAARLRQKLPQLKNGLENAGWPVDTIRIKVKLKNPVRQQSAPQKKPLPKEALAELERLETWLSQSGTHPALAEAVRTMVKRHQKTPK
jgi:hypothetical protein